MSDSTVQEPPQVVTRKPRDGWFLLEPTDCPLRAQHIQGPSGYIAWDEWAERMRKTHKQMRCAGCHRWSVWVPYGGSAVINGIDAQVIAAGRHSDV